MSSVLATHFTHNSLKSHFAKYQCFKKQASRLKHMYHTYNSIEDLYESFKQQVSMSFVMTNVSKYYSIIKKERKKERKKKKERKGRSKFLFC